MSVSFRLYNNAAPGYSPLAPFGGLYHLNTGNAYAADANLPHIIAARVVEQWATLNPAPGVYNWTQLESDMAPWVNAGKQVLLRIHTSQSAYVGAVTPAWVLASGVRSVAETDGSTIPVRWDPGFLDAYDAFIAAFAAVYDGDPRVIALHMGLGGNADISADNTSNTLAGKQALWNAVGYSDAVWEATLLSMIGSYVAAFAHTPLTAIINASAFLGGETMNTFVPKLPSAGTHVWPQSNSLGLLPNAVVPIIQAPPYRCLCVEQKTGSANSGDDLIQDIQAGMQMGARYIGLYPGDVEGGSPALAWAHAQIGKMW